MTAGSDSVNDDTTVHATAKLLAYCGGVATRANYRGGGHLRNVDQVSRRISRHRVRVGTLRDGLDKKAVATYHAKHRAELRRRGDDGRRTNGRRCVRFTGAQIVPVITDEARGSVDRGVEPDFVGAGDIYDIRKGRRKGGEKINQPLAGGIDDLGGRVERVVTRGAAQQQIVTPIGVGADRDTVGPTSAPSDIRVRGPKGKHPGFGGRIEGAHRAKSSR